MCLPAYITLKHTFLSNAGHTNLQDKVDMFQDKVDMLQDQVKSLEDKLIWARFRTQLKQALGNTITRWWSYYRTPAAVRTVRSSLIPRPPHCKTMGGAGTFIMHVHI